MAFHCTITPWCSAPFPRTEGILFYWRIGGEIVCFSFSFFFIICLTSGYFFMEGKLLEWSWIIRAETGPQFLASKSSKLQVFLAPICPCGMRRVLLMLQSLHEAEVPQMSGMAVPLHSLLRFQPPMVFWHLFPFQDFFQLYLFTDLKFSLVCKVMRT